MDREQGRGRNRRDDLEKCRRLAGAGCSPPPPTMSRVNQLMRTTLCRVNARGLATASTAAPAPLRPSTPSPVSAFDSALYDSNNPVTPLFSIPATRIPPPPSLDPTADTALLSTLARLIMKSGKLARAHTHLSTCLASLALTTSSPPMPILTRALEVVAPSVRVVGRRKGTKSLPTPQPLTAEQRTRQAWKWIVESSEKRQGAEKIFGKRLALEVLSVLSGQSEAIKKKEARHQAAVIGRANVGR